MMAYCPGRRHATCLESVSGTGQPLRLPFVMLGDTMPHLRPSQGIQSQSTQNPHQLCDWAQIEAANVSLQNSECTRVMLWLCSAVQPCDMASDHKVYPGYCAEGEGTDGREQPAAARRPSRRTRAPNRAAVASVVTAEAAHAVSEDQHEGGDAAGVESSRRGWRRLCRSRVNFLVLG